MSHSSSPTPDSPSESALATRTSAQPGTAMYQSPLSRRDSLKLLAALAASSWLLPLAGCGPAAPTNPPTAQPAALPLTGSTYTPWPTLTLPPVNARGYGKDPHLIMPPAAPWPLTLSAAELHTLSVLTNLIMPADGALPAAASLGVPTVLDEWVSAPYPAQQQDRLAILSLLHWLDSEAQRLFAGRFSTITAAQQSSMLDVIADAVPPAAAEKAPADHITVQHQAALAVLASARAAFDRCRQLTVAAYFCTPEGSKELGYQGNVAIAGAYPGPSAAAYQHLQQQLTQLALTEFAYPHSAP